LWRVVRRFLTSRELNKLNVTNSQPPAERAAKSNI
jgi:hypothetical protein